ncbi:MAG: GlxA family transcriptional regulator [Cohaesibacter sp.]|nr:GlxA family transcriptional regulator [Cohaesibacter sp.]
MPHSAKNRKLAPTRPRLSVAFILARHFTLSAFASFVDVLRLSADEGDSSRKILCDWTVLSSTMRPILSSCGIQVQPTEKLGNPQRFDYIAVVGGLMDEVENLDAEVNAFLIHAAQKKVPLIGLCTGAFTLHRLGLMKGRQCCVSWFHRDDFLEQFSGLNPVSNQIFVIDGDRLTCSGGVSSAHLAAHLVSKHVGSSQARKSLNIMIIDEAQQSEKPQPGIPLSLASSDPQVKHALLIMQETMEHPISVGALAKRMKLSRRTLEQRFEVSLAMSPREANIRIRLDYAKYLMADPAHSIAQIAAMTGFCDASHFARIFKHTMMQTPGAYRASLQN